MKKVFKIVRLLVLGYIGLALLAILRDYLLPYRLDELDCVDIESTDFDFGGLQEHHWTVLGKLENPIPDTWQPELDMKYSECEHHIDFFREHCPDIQANDVVGYTLPSNPSLHAVILHHRTDGRIYVSMWR